MGWGGGVVAHVILVSALGPNPSFFFFGGLLFDLGACLDKGLDSDLDQGLTMMTAMIMIMMTAIIMIMMTVMIMIMLPEAGSAPVVRLRHVDQGRQ